MAVATLSSRLQSRRSLRIYAIVFVALLLFHQLDSKDSYIGRRFSGEKSANVRDSTNSKQDAKVAPERENDPLGQSEALEFELRKKIRERDVELRRLESIAGEVEAEDARFTKLLETPDTIRMQGEVVRRTEANSTCTIVACFTKDTPGAKHFYNYYKKSGYTVITTETEKVTYKGEVTNPVWCRIPAVLNAKRENPEARVLYLDIDTKVSLGDWCNFGALGKDAPIIMNSFYRGRPYIFRDFTLNGTRVQANAFVVAAGDVGLAAMKRWEQAYWEGQYRDQGAVHLQEGGLCGVPGWIHCYSNPEQQKCHCTGVTDSKKKDQCINELYKGKKKDCVVTN